MLFQRVFRKVFRLDICNFEIYLLGVGRFLDIFSAVSFSFVQTELSFSFKTFIRFGLLFRLRGMLLFVGQRSGHEKVQDGEKSFTGLI